MSKYAPAQLKVLKKIREKKAELRAEISISVGLRKDAYKKLKTEMVRNRTKIDALETHYDSLISTLESDLRIKIDAIQAPELTLEAECSGHDSDVTVMRRQLDKLQLEEESLKPKKPYCTHCGQVAR